MGREEFKIKLAEKLKTEGYELLEDYTNSTTKTLVKHKCGYEWRIAPNHLYNSVGCPICNRTTKQQDRIKTKIEEQTPEGYQIVDYNINSKNTRESSIKIKHNQCGAIKDIKFRMLNGYTCTDCRKEETARKKANEFFTKNNSKYRAIFPYPGIEEKQAMFKCIDCNTVFKANKSNIRQRLDSIFCPKCNISRSGFEDRINNLIRSLGYNTIKYRDIFELDIYIPELKIRFRM